MHNRINLKFFFVLLLELMIIKSGMCQVNKTYVDSLNNPIIKFTAKTIDIGTLSINGNKTFMYTFKNIGRKPLIINELKTSCGCTVAETSSKTILPNEEGKIIVRYNASSIPGVVRKSIVVVANTLEKCYLLRFKAIVVER